MIDLAHTPWRRLELSERRGIWCLVDADDWDWIVSKNWNWGWHRNTPQKFYAKRNVGSARSTIYLHREIMLRAEPDADRALDVDHRNGQPLDNRKANLRWVTRAVNNANRWPVAPELDDIVARLLRHWRPDAAAAAIAAEAQVPF